MPKSNSTQSRPRYHIIKSLNPQGFSLLPVKNPLKMERYRNLRIYYGVNNLKAGNIDHNKRGAMVFKADPAKDWYVRYDFWDDVEGKYKAVAVRRGLNRIHNLSDKMEAAQSLLIAVREELESGFNPIVIRYESSTGNVETSDVQGMNVRDALMWALDKKTKLSNGTKSGYKTNIRYFCDGMDLAGYGLLPVTMATRSHIKEGISKLTSMVRPKLSPGSVNDYLTNLGGLFTTLIEWEVIDKNPMDGIKKEDEMETEGFVPPTDEEMIVIKEELKQAPFGFLLYCMLIHQTGIRPKELNRMQVKDIDFKRLFIKLMPEYVEQAGERKTKTRKIREVPITELTAGLLKQQIGKTINPDAFPFSKNFECTNEYEHRNRYSEMWKAIIKDKHGIKADMYGLKPRGADDRKDQNVSDDALAHMFGHHSNILVRKIYNKKKDIYNDQLRDSTPEF